MRMTTVEEIIDNLEGSQFTLKNLEKAFNSKGIVIMCGVNDDIICWDSRKQDSGIYSLYLDDKGIIIQADYEGK